MSLKVGDPAPDCTFLRPDGTPLPLASFAGRTVVLVFLRHLA